MWGRGTKTRTRSGGCQRCARGSAARTGGAIRAITSVAAISGSGFSGCGGKMCAWRESNPQPSDPKSDALSIEPQAQKSTNEADSGDPGGHPSSAAGIVTTAGPRQDLDAVRVDTILPRRLHDQAATEGSPPGLGETTIQLRAEIGGLYFRGYPRCADFAASATSA